MPASPSQRRIARFGLYEADLGARELRREGTKVKLQDRPFDVLTILIERPGEVISREEFRQRLWPADTFVDFDSSLNTSINKLRQALGDTAENPRFIATAGRRGYRFVAPTAWAEDGHHAGAAVSAAPAEGTRKEPTKAAERAQLPWLRAAVVVGVCAVLIAGAVVVDAMLPRPEPRVLNITQISRDEHLDPWGRLTTDGARLFFLERDGGHWNVMQVPASGGEARPFPEPSQGTRMVAISPDRSEFLSFTFVFRGSDLPLSITPVVGGPPRRVGDIVADDAVFSPDGRKIFFTKPGGIYSCDRDGSHVQRFVALPGRSEDPRWSPDGRRFRFTLFDRVTDGSTIWEVSADGSGLHAVLKGLGFPGEECCGEWSGDGRYFFFDSIRDGERSVWAIRDGKRSWLDRAPKPVQLTFGPKNYGAATPDGNRASVFVWGGTEQHELVRYDRMSKRVEPLLPMNHSPAVALSQDGLWLAFPSAGTLWKSRIDGSERTPVASGLTQIGGVQWSPEGKRILFRTPEGLFLVPSDGGTLVPLSLGPGQNEPAWSPDGQSLIYSKWAEEGGVSRADSGIYSFDLGTSKATKIPQSEGLIHPMYSPDKRFLVAVTAVHLNPMQPAVVKLLDTQAQRWTSIAEGKLVNPITWSPDSKYLYYQDILGENEPVYRYRIGGTKPEVFFDFAGLLHAGYVRCAFVRFAPDGELIASLTRGDTDLYRLDLDLP